MCEFKICTCSGHWLFYWSSLDLVIIVTLSLPIWLDKWLYNLQIFETFVFKIETGFWKKHSIWNRDETLNGCIISHHINRLLIDSKYALLNVKIIHRIDKACSHWRSQTWHMKSLSVVTLWSYENKSSHRMTLLLWTICIEIFR